MSVIGDVFDGLRNVFVLQDRIERLAADLQALETLHRDTRERMIRMEAIVEEARHTRDVRRLRDDR